MNFVSKVNINVIALLHAVVSKRSFLHYKWPGSQVEETIIVVFADMPSVFVDHLVVGRVHYLTPTSSSFESTIQ